MIKELYHWYDPTYGRPIDVDAAYTIAVFNNAPIVYFTLFERDYLDTLQLMHGTQVKLISVWDWFDEVWDKINDRTQNCTLRDCFHNILTTQGHMHRLVERMDPYVIERMKKIALKSYECRNDKPIYFTGSLKEFLV